MNCNCINDIEKRLEKQFSEQLCKPAKVECQSAGFSLGKSLAIIHKTEFKIKFKITADAPGYKRGMPLSLIASFCPFCGKSTKAEEKAA